ncbi:MAG: trypsin-like serine protease [Bacteroidales bacterium]
MKSNHFYNVFIVFFLSIIFLSGTLNGQSKDNTNSTLSEKFEATPGKPAFDSDKEFEEFMEKFSSRGGKIVGGEDADIIDYPWQVSLQVAYGADLYHFCGGTILNEEWVLTASHCLEDFDDPGQFRVRVGFTSQSSAEGSVYSVSEMIMHEEYDPDNINNDVALVRLSSQLDFENPKTQPLAIATEEDADNGLTDPGVIAKISGWGALSEGGSSPDILQAAEVPIKALNETSYPPSMITPGMIIAGGDGIDACQGDSGGPLAVPDGEGWYKVAGGTSWGVGCGEPGYPGVYARVSYFETWIKDHVVYTDPNQYTTLFYEDFGSTEDIPTGWENIVIAGPDGFPGWEWTDVGGNYGGQINSTTAHNGYMMLDSDGNGAAGSPEEADLITPSYDLSGITEDLFFSVEHLARTFGAADVSIYISTDDFASQTELYRWYDAAQNDFNGSNPVKSVFDITSIAQGESNVKFKFKWIGEYDYWWLVDDFKIFFENPSLQVDFHVTDGTDPLADAYVATEYTGQEAITDGTGIATLNLYDGDYNFTVEKDGYFIYESSVTITEDGQVVSVVMDKIPAPEIAVNPENIAIDVKQNLTSSTILNIANNGDANLEFALFAYAAEGLKTTNSRIANSVVHYDGYDVNNENSFSSIKHENTNESEPKVKETVELHYDTGFDSSIGTNSATSWITAVRFTSEELADYYGAFELSSVKYHISTDDFDNVVVKVWRGGSDQGPETEIYSENVTADVDAGNWSIHELTEAIELLPGEEYWIGYSISATGGYPSSTDEGPMVPYKGGWMYLNGSWSLLPEINESLDFNWCIRGIINRIAGVDWLSMDITEGILEPGQDIDIELGFDASGLELGDYQADLFIVNNDENLTVPVTMSVIPAVFDVSFVLADPDGIPIDDAIITLNETTNTAGDYLFPDVPVGMYEYNITAPGFLDATGYINLVDQDLIVTLMMIPEGSVTYDVTVQIDDEFGEPVAEALFTIDNLGTFMSDEFGAISFTAIEGDYNYTAEKYGFENFTGSQTINDNALIEITLTYLRYNVTLISDPAEGGLLTGQGEYYHGELATIEAIPEDFYNFLYWEYDGVSVSETPEYSFEVFEDMTITGHFELYRYQITATAEPVDGGTINGTDEYFHGDEVTLVASPASGYHFVKWTEDDIEIDGEGATYVFLALEDRDLVAHFELNTYKLTFVVKDADNATIADAIIEFDGITYDPGEYVFEDLLPGTYDYVVSKEGYFDTADDVTITNQNKVENVVLNIDNTSIEESFDLGVKVFPNPANDILKVNSEELINEIQIYDLAGKLLIQYSPAANSTEIMINELESGLYFIRVIADSKSATYKFQKQ